MVLNHQAKNVNSSYYSQAQKNNGVAAFIDAEHAFDPSYAVETRR